MSTDKEQGYNMGAADALGDIWGGHAHILDLALPDVQDAPVDDLPQFAYQGSRAFTRKFMEFTAVTPQYLQASDRILEVGPGRGPLVEQMLLMRSPAAWVGVEFSQHNADRLIRNAWQLGGEVCQFTLDMYRDAARGRQELPQYIIIVDDAHRVLPHLAVLRDKFDRVLAMECIMHMRREDVLSWAFDLLQPGGLIGWTDVNLSVRTAFRRALNPFFEMGFNTTFEGSVETYESMLSYHTAPLEHANLQEAFDASNALALRLLAHEDYVRQALARYSNYVLLQLRTALRVIAPSQEYRLFRVCPN